MKRPPELYEFLKPTGKDSEKRVISRSLKYWRLQTPKASASQEEKPRELKEQKSGSARGERRKAASKRPSPSREEAAVAATPSGYTKRSGARLTLSPFTLSLVATFLVVLVGVAYVLGRGMIPGLGPPSLRADAIEATDTVDRGFTVQVVFWRTIGKGEDDLAQTVVAFLLKDDYLKKLGGNPRIVHVRGPGETRVYVGLAPAKNDPTLLKLLDRISTYEAPLEGKKNRLFESPFIRLYNDHSPS